MEVLSVADYLSLVNETLSLIPSETHVIEGEISDYRVSQGKWINFSLKDEEAEASLPCFATVYQVSLPLEDGMRVRVQGYARVYERFGKFSLNVRDVEPVGEGALRKAYEVLKKKLESEGLFDTSRKRDLPRFPNHVGVITSREAAAYTDFLRIAGNRWGGARIELAPVHVQGQYAVREILGAFEHFNALPKKDQPEVLVLTRGGGSLEDLHAFNSEEVARAIFRSAIPVVAGVGHERDESLADFVADVRASTPSNAAERVFPDKAQILYEIQTSVDVVEGRLRRQIEERASLVRQAASSMMVFFERLEHVASDLTGRLMRAFDQRRDQLLDSVSHAQKLLQQVDPKRVLARGYSIVKSGERLVKDASKLEVGQGLQVQLARGSFEAEVLKVTGKQ